MFKNPFREHSNWKESDPLHDMNTSPVLEAGEFSPHLKPQVFHPIFDGNLGQDDSGESSTLQSEQPGEHFVHPHYVHDYVRSDGTHVDGYWRDGDGNTDHDLSVDQGGGYVQTNPDHDPFNNFGS